MPQVVGELRHLRGEVGVGHRLAHQLAELLALLGPQGGHHPVGRGLSSGEGVDQLVDVLGVLREHLAVLVHEVGEAVGGVLAARVGGQQVVEVGHHVLDRLHGLRVTVLEEALHPGELRVEDLALQHLLDRLVRRARLGRAPLVRIERPDGAGGVVGQRGQVHLGQPGVVGVHPRQRLGLGGQRLVERGPDLVEGAGQVTAPLGGLAHPAGSLPQLVEPAATVDPTSHQVTQRLPQRAAGQHVLADLVERLAHVVRRRRGVRPAVPRAVAEPGVAHAP
jgi:hypothetical protein